MIDPLIFIIATPNGHLLEALYEHISLCPFNEKYVNWRTWRTQYPPLNLKLKWNKIELNLILQLYTL